TSGKAKEWFEEKGINVIEWPSQSPDLNPIALGSIKRASYSKHGPAKGIHDCWDHLAEEWNAITVEQCRNLVESMGRRCEAVIKAKGANTKY
ncbi:hypothetical protein T439DRAFT_371367, partial [Meredithblackwellia eburnea MCA 4105]